MADYIGSPPTKYVIPVTKGADREFTLRRRNTEGDPVNWDAELYIDIDIDKTDPTRVEAEVEGDEAVLRIESTILDLVKNSTKWRIVRSADDTPESFEIAVAVGTFERFDG